MRANGGMTPPPVGIPGSTSAVRTAIKRSNAGSSARIRGTCTNCPPPQKSLMDYPGWTLLLVSTIRALLGSHPRTRHPLCVACLGPHAAARTTAQFPHQPRRLQSNVQNVAPRRSPACHRAGSLAPPAYSASAPAGSFLGLLDSRCHSLNPPFPILPAKISPPLTLIERRDPP